jgi:hypothetical protein
MDAATRKQHRFSPAVLPARPTWACWGLLTVVLVAQLGCRGAGEVTDRMVPRQWKGNPWGPEADGARRCGRLPAIPYNPPMVVWDDWARRNLCDGDILFRMGDARAACGLFPFSKISAAMADSRYSHTGIVAWEEGAPFVYDTTTTGPRRQPFAIWLLDTAGGFAVKRPVSGCQQYVPAALAFCRATYHHQTPFDRDLGLGDDRLYCIELTERSYRSAGLALSEPLRIEQLPRYKEFPNIVRLARLCSPLEPEQEAYIIGNDRVGIWSSPALELVYEAPDAFLPYAGSASPDPRLARK